jgi:hypothetical protein
MTGAEIKTILSFIKKTSFAVRGGYSRRKPVGVIELLNGIILYVECRNSLAIPSQIWLLIIDELVTE